MKRKVVYDYKLMKSFAFVTQNWEAMKERYILYCTPFWDKRTNDNLSLNEAFNKLCREGLMDRMKEKGISYNPNYTAFMTTMIEMRSKDPITAWFHELDDLNKQLTLQFLLVCAGDLPEKIMDYEVEVSPEEIHKEEELCGEILGSKRNNEEIDINSEGHTPF